MMQLEFELTYYSVIAQNTNHYTKGTLHHRFNKFMYTLA